MIKEIIAIGAGGALGAISRFLAANGLYYWLGKEFPYGTLFVNVLGSFLMGFLAIILLDRMPQYNPVLTGFLLVGLLGGFTTFSTFSIETVRLFFDGQMVLAFLNIFGNVLACLLATSIGVYLAMQTMH